MPRLSTCVKTHWSLLKGTNGICAKATNADQSRSKNNVTIVLARADSEAIASREVIYVADRQDILVEVADYWDRDPQGGDTFVYKQAGMTVTAEARPQSESEACFYRWYGGLVYRVHCKVVSREP